MAHTMSFHSWLTRKQRRPGVKVAALRQAFGQTAFNQNDDLTVSKVIIDRSGCIQIMTRKYVLCNATGFRAPGTPEELWQRLLLAGYHGEIEFR